MAITILHEKTFSQLVYFENDHPQIVYKKSLQALGNCSPK